MTWAGKLLLSGVAALLGATTMLAGAPAANAAHRHLVALGDSYASGVGTRLYFESSGRCKRSPYAYPVLDAHRLGARLTFAACAGATIGGVMQDQLPLVTVDATDVMLTVGGNDAGFAAVVLACAEPRWLGHCRAAVTAARSYIARKLPRRLDRLYDALDGAAPAAQVVVVGYPRLFNGEDCNAGTWFSPAEEHRLNVTAGLLDSVLAERALAAGFAFVDPRPAFTGHAICTAEEWVNGLSYPVRESYHPNRRGQRGYAALVYRRLKY
jgi:lysophospholipase L1-like esterase